MPNLPQKLMWDQAQTKWAGTLNPIINSPLTNPLILQGIKIVAGDNVINHLLQRRQQGWIISDIDAAISLYRSQAFNDLTLTLTSSGNATVNLVVF